MRRLPVYLLIDVSESMSGEPIESVRNALELLVSALRKNPQALETVFLSVITFASEAQQIVPFTWLADFQIPDFSISKGSALGAALKLLCQRRDEEIVKGTSEKRGDWLPVVIIMTDGLLTDNPTVGIEEFNKRKWGNAVSCAAGTAANTELLKQITPEQVVELATADQTSLEDFFKYVIYPSFWHRNSPCCTNACSEDLDTLPPPPPGISLVD